MRGEQAIFNLEIKKKSGLSINPDIHHSKVFSSDLFKRPMASLLQGWPWRGEGADQKLTNM